MFTFKGKEEEGEIALFKGEKEKKGEIALSLSTLVGRISRH